MGRHIVVVGANFEDVAIDSRTRVIITPTPSSISVTAESTQSLTITTVPAAATLAVTSLNTSVATVSGSSGTYTITGVSAGSTSIQIVATPTDTQTYKPTTMTIGCTVVSPEVRTLLSIAVTTMPTKITYNVGDALDLTGCVITGTYNLAPLTEEVTSSCTFVPANGSTLSTGGVQTVNVSYSGKSTSFNVTVQASGEIDITSTAVTTAGGTIDGAGDITTSSAVFDLKTIDVTAYKGKYLRFAGMSYNLTGGKQSNYFYGLYESSTGGTAIQNQRIPAAASGWKKKGSLLDTVFQIPTGGGNVYLICSFFNDSASSTAAIAPEGTHIYDDGIPFYAKISDTIPTLQASGTVTNGTPATLTTQSVTSFETYTSEVITPSSGYELPSAASCVVGLYTSASFNSNNQLVVTGVGSSLNISVECVSAIPWTDITSTAITTSGYVYSGSTDAIITTGVMDLKTINVSQYKGGQIKFSGYTYSASGGGISGYAYYFSPTEDTVTPAETKLSEPVRFAKATDSSWKKKGALQEFIVSVPSTSENVYLVTSFFQTSMSTTPAAGGGGYVYDEGTPFYIYGRNL